MIKGKVAYFILGIVVFSALLLRIFSPEGSWVCVNGYWEKHGNTSKAQPQEKCGDGISNINENFVLEGGKVTPTVSTASDTSFVSDDVTTTATTSVSATFNRDRLATISAPQADSVVSSPLVVKGEAPGTWFFEASFPVHLLDNQGNLIVTAIASAQSDPLTENFVSYKALLEFNTTATSGYLLLNNDNPSGLPENSLSVKIPVKFLNK